MPLPAALTGVRPTGARARSAIFDRLQIETRGAAVLDPFAGTGALAIEAISRGATSATCVEADAPTVEFLRRQVAALGLDGEVAVVHDDAVAWLERGRPATHPPVTLAILDPPYAARDLYERSAAALLSGGWLAPDAIVVAELMPAAVAGLTWPDGLALEARRDHGQTALEFLRAPGSQPTPE